MLRRCTSVLVPGAAGILLAAALAGACLLLQAGLRRPSAAEQLAARVVSRVERIRSTRTVELVHGLHRMDSVCVVRSRSDRLSLGRRIRYTIIGTTAKAVGRRAAQGRYVAAQADLAACPRLIANELSGRLLTGAPVTLDATGLSRVRAYVLRINNRPPVVRLFVRRATLAPLAVEFLGRRVQGFSRIIAVTLRRTVRAEDRF